MERDTNEMLTDAGVPPRPFGRLWLLRPPPPFADLDGVVQAITRGADADRVPLMCCTALVVWTHAAIAHWFQGTA